MTEHVRTGGAGTEAPSVPPQPEVARFYDEISRLMTELFGGSLHEGYWESESDQSTMVEASRRLTALLADKLAVGPDDSVLDIGCGNGAPTIQLAQDTGARAVGVTNSPLQIQLAAENARAAGLGDRVTFRCEDATVLRFPARSFDAVLMIESIFHLPDRFEALRQVAGVLKPGGRVALTDMLDRTATTIDDLAEHSRSQGHSPLVADPIPLWAYDDLLERAGLRLVEKIDVTEHTVAPTLASIKQKLADERDDLLERFGSQVVERYASVLPLLESAGFGYGIIVAAPHAG